MRKHDYTTFPGAAFFVILLLLNCWIWQPGHPEKFDESAKRLSLVKRAKQFAK